MNLKRILKFQASWCQPCKMLSKVFEEIQTDIPVIEIDIDDNSVYAQEYKIRGVPTLIMLDDTIEIKRKTGLLSKAELEAWIND